MLNFRLDRIGGAHASLDRGFPVPFLAGRQLIFSFSQKTTDKPKPPASQAPVPSAPADSSNRLPVKRVVLYMQRRSAVARVGLD